MTVALSLISGRMLLRSTVVTIGFDERLIFWFLSASKRRCENNWPKCTVGTNSL